MSEFNEFENQNTDNDATPEEATENITPAEEVTQANEAAETETFETVEEPSAPEHGSWKKEVVEWVSSIAIALVIALILRNFVFTLVKVDGTSMVPTLQHNERLVVTRLGYTPQFGDIIVFTPRNRTEPFIKRVIGMPGQTVVINNQTGDVVVDGVKIDEPYINNQTLSAQSTFTVPEGHVFVMGDNRGNSHDSRAEDVGFVSFESIMGKANLRIWPFNRIGVLK